MAWHGGETQMCAATKYELCFLEIYQIRLARKNKERASKMRRGELSMTEETVDWETQFAMTGKGGFSMAGK